MHSDARAVDSHAPTTNRVGPAQQRTNRSGHMALILPCLSVEPAHEQEDFSCMHALQPRLGPPRDPTTLNSNTSPA